MTARMQHDLAIFFHLDDLIAWWFYFFSNAVLRTLNWRIVFFITHSCRNGKMAWWVSKNPALSVFVDNFDSLSYNDVLMMFFSTSLCLFLGLNVPVELFTFLSVLSSLRLTPCRDTILSKSDFTIWHVCECIVSK